MITKNMSVRHKWFGALAVAILVAFAGSSPVAAGVLKDRLTIEKKQVVKKALPVKRKYKRVSKRAAASKSRKIGARKAAPVRIYKKKKASLKIVKKSRSTRTARKNKKRIVAKRVTKKRTVAKRVYKKRYTKKSRKNARRYATKSTRRALRKNKRSRRARSRGRGSLMATLRSVKPKGLPLRLAAAVVTVESGWRVNARGSSGERGLMQLMPATARMMGARGNLYNPTINMRAGTKYLNWCYRRARRNVAATIGCYNRGPGLMWKWSGNPITRRYVGKVRRYMGRRG